MRGPHIVFVGRDGKSVFASKRGTYDLGGFSYKRNALGNDKSVAFRLPCNPALDWVAVFEAPIDLISFCTLHRAVTSNAVALCGLYQGPLDTYLRENPHLKQIVLCLDAEKFREEYGQKGYTVPTRTPAHGKDWSRQMSGVQAINAVNAAWNVKKRFFFSGGVFYWGEKPEQQKIYTFEYGVNIINLLQIGGVWELGTVSAPFIRHSHKINVVHPKISGEQEVVKMVSSTDDDGFIRTRSYF